jgi:HlyD family type I secretion membrane fusion protein
VEEPDNNLVVERPEEAPREKGGLLARLIPGGEAQLPEWVSRTSDRFFPPDIVVANDDKAFMATERLVRRGNLVMAVFVIGGLLWAALAPLESAIVARGEIVVKTHRKTIQHLEGGIVSDIKVTEGQQVSAGQVLIRLDETQTRANLGALQGEADAMAAQEARLITERDGKDHIDFPAFLIARKNEPSAAEAMRGEQNAFNARKTTLGQQVGILGQKGGENARLIAGLRSQQEAVRSQAALIQQEIKSVEGLYKEGLATLPRLLELKRQAADLAGQDGQLTEKIAQAQLQTGENNLQISNVQDKQYSDIVESLRDVQTKKFETLDRIHALQDTLAHTTMRAPVGGVVLNLSVHTIGAVIKPGDTVMEIVPKDDSLQVQAQLKPEDADEVHPGMPARVNLSSYKQRRLPIIEGTVDNVSADRMTDQRTGQPYFNVEVTVARDALKDYPETRLIPGMPVDVEIGTGTRTMLQYLVEPVTDVLRHGMREK